MIRIAKAFFLFTTPLILAGGEVLVDKCQPDRKAEVTTVDSSGQLSVRCERQVKKIQVDGKLLSYKIVRWSDSFLAVLVDSTPGTSIAVQEIHVFGLCNGKLKEALVCASKSKEGFPGGSSYEVGFSYEGNDRVKITKAGHPASMDLNFDAKRFVFCPSGKQGQKVKFNIFGQLVMFSGGNWSYQF